MRKGILIFLLLAVVSISILSTGVVRAQGESVKPDARKLVETIDASISSLRRGDADGAKTLLSLASDWYDNYFSPNVGDNSLDNQIKEHFASLKGNPVEKDIFTLRGKILQVAPLSAFYEYSIFVILAIAAAVSLGTTVITKRAVDWEKVRRNKAEVSKFYNQLREAMKKRDAKEVHKLQQMRPEISKLQGEIFSQTMKPAIFYLIPIMIIWIILLNLYSGWVVAWLPFTIDLPFFGRLVAFGVGWWYIISSFGFSQIFRKIMIRD